MNNKKTADVLMILSAVATILAAIDFFTQSNIFKLAGTQWILIAIVLGIYGLYAKQKMAA